MSKRLYTAAVDGLFKTLSNDDKERLTSLGRELAETDNPREADNVIQNLNHFLDEALSHNHSRPKADSDSDSFYQDNHIVSEATLEKFDQLTYTGTGHILLGNKFDLRYVGKGDGSAAYGYGAYLSTSKDFADAYRKVGLLNHGEGNVILTLNGQSYSSADKWNGLNDDTLRDALDDILFWLNDDEDFVSFKGAKEIAISSLNDKINESSSDDEIHNLKRIIDIIQNNLHTVNPKNGNIYIFDAPENEVLLDWRTPTSR